MTASSERIIIDNFSITNYTVTTPTSVVLSNTGTPGTGSVTKGTQDVALFGFQLAPSGGNMDFTAATITKTGTSTTSDISDLKIWLDNNNNGIRDAGDTDGI